MPKQIFNKLLLEAVDEGLSSLGESAKQAIYFYLKNSFNIKKKEIPFKLEAFNNGIEKIFGLGADFLKVLVLKSLYEKIGMVFEWHESTSFDFVKSVAVVKRSFLRKKESGKLAAGSQFPSAL